MLKLQQSYPDNFNQTLPVFLYTNPDALQSIASEMDRTIAKSTKLISLHSITAKPEVKSEKELTQKELEFYNKKEFNKWVDEAYLLMGKAHFYKSDYDKAKETFQYLNNNFKEEPAVFESHLWLARLAIEKGKNKKAENILATLKKNIDFPKKLKGELNATEAHYNILNGNSEQAIVSLKKAVEQVSDKYHKTRYTYILAQLYQERGDNFQASEQYKKVIKLNPPYEMTFNAKINRALTYQTSSGSGKDIEKQLKKMLKDDKNIEFQDQIYYALGELAMKNGDQELAIEFYKKSVSVSAGNNNQLALSNLTLANIYYEIPDYINAQAYYDSTVAVIQPDYPDYQIIYAKSISLTNLVQHIQTVALEDSVQQLAKMPEPELRSFIDDLITKAKEEDEARRLRQQELAQFNNEFSTQTLSGPAFGGSDKWYFYNTTSLQVGRSDFKKYWGNRKLEDNWRRKNKSSISYDIETLSDAQEEGQPGVEGRQDKTVTNKYSPEFYMQNIPLTDSMMNLSHGRIKNALFEMGNIYGSELKDYEKAIHAYTDLLQRYPGYDNKLQVYYKLYVIGKESENKDLLATYQQKIISEFPNSLYAQVLTNPDFVKQLEAQERELENTYNKTYQSFKQREFTRVTSMSKAAMEKFPESELIPQFDYMLTISEGISKDTLSFIDDLQKLISRYPGSEIAEQTNILVTYLKEGHPEIAAKHEEIKAEELYKESEQEEEHYFAISLPPGRNTNQLIFNIINFNLDEYPETKLNVKKQNLDSDNLLCVVDKFENAKIAMEYLNKIKLYNDLWKDVEFRGSRMFIISVSNMNVLKQQKDIDRYNIFYKNHYTVE